MATDARVSKITPGPGPRKVRDKQDLCRVLVGTFARHGFSQKQVAETCLTNRQQVGRWCSPLFPGAPSALHMLRLPRPVALDLMRWMARHHEADLTTRCSSYDLFEALATVEGAGSGARAAHLTLINAPTPAALADSARKHRAAADAHRRAANLAADELDKAVGQ